MVEYDSDFYKSLSPELVKFLKELSELSEIIGLRGYFTQEVLSKLGINNTEVIGCPSFYENGAERIIKKRDSILTSDLPINDLSENYTCLQDKHELGCINLITNGKFSDKITFKQYYNIYNEKYRFFTNFNEWKNFLSGFAFATGFRLHGSILSINSGVPALCLNGDARAKEMCEYLKIPHFKDISTEMNFMDLYQRADIDELNNAYPQLYKTYDNYLKKVMHIDNFELQENVLEFIQPSIQLYKSLDKNSLLPVGVSLRMIQ